MYRYVGIAVLVFMFTYIGCLYAGRFKKSADSLKALIRFVDYIRSQIMYFNKALADIFNEYQDSEIEGFIKSVNKFGLQKGIDLNKKGLMLDRESYSLLCDFAKGLGGGSREEQSDFCEYYKNALLKIYEDKNSQLGKNRKLYSTLGLMAGILCAVLLI